MCEIGRGEEDFYLHAFSFETWWFALLPNVMK